MEAYIEIALIHHLFLLFIIFKFIKIITLKRIKQQAINTYIILSILIACCFNKHAFLIWLLFEISACLFLFRNSIKVYFLMWGIRISVYLIIYLLGEVSFHQGIVFFNMNYNLYLLFLCEIITFIYLKTNRCYQLVLRQFTYYVMIYTPTPISLKVYLDSGNFASYKQVPIMILDQKYEDRFKSCKSHKYYYHSINSDNLIDLYQCKISFNNEVSNVYVCFKSLSLKNNYEGLLNIKMIGRN